MVMFCNAHTLAPIDQLLIIGQYSVISDWLVVSKAVHKQGSDDAKPNSLTYYLAHSLFLCHPVIDLYGLL